MADSFAPRRPRWLLLIGVAAALLLVLYFVLTSGVFIRAVVLPRVSSALGAVVTAEDISLSPFSSLEIRRLSVTPAGAETLATVERIQVRYGLLAILGGNIDVSEVTVENPVITLVSKPDGSLNLPKSEPSTSSSGGPANPEPPKLNLRNINLRNATVRATLNGTNGTQVSEITGLNLSLDRLANGAQGKLTIAAALSSRLPDRSELSGKIDGAYEVGLDAKLQPTLLKGALTTTVVSAAGSLKDLSGLQVVLDADSTASELRRLRIAFSQSGQAFAEVRLSGPFDLVKKEARISYFIGGLDRRVVRLAAPGLPFDLGKTVVSAEGRVDLVQLGKLVTSQGKLTVADLTLSSTNGTTPPLQVGLEYKGGVNLDEHTAVVEKVEIGINQAGRSLVSGNLDRPMNLSWDRASKGFRDSTFTLKLSGLNTRDWAAVAGPSVPQAIVSADLVLRADHDGRDIKASLSARVDDIVAQVGDRTLRGSRVALLLEAVMLEFNDLGISKLSLDVLKGETRFINLSGTLNHSLNRKETGAQFSGEVNLPAVLNEFPVEGVRSATGGVRLAGAFSAKEGTTNVSANVSLANFTGSVRDMEFRDYQASVNLSADIAGSTLSIQKLGITAQTAYAAGGSFDLTGRYDLAQGGGEVSYKAVNLNESALGPLVASALKPNRLVSVSIDINGAAKFTPTLDADLTTELKVSRLVAEDPAGRLPKTPLALGLNLDVARKSTVIDIKSVRLDLGKTTNAANQLTLNGRIDSAVSNATPSTLSLKSDGLDLTTLYTLFAGDSAPAKTPAGQPAPTVASATATAAPGEPAPVSLPFRQFTAEVDIARILLREVDVAGWKAGLQIQNGTVTLDPFALRLNGAPVTAKVVADLGVPGFRYDVGFGLDQVPLEPLVNTFQPARHGQIHGKLVANGAVKGAGITGASLASNLNGNFAFAATNLNLTLEDSTNPLLKLIIGVVVDLPRLIKNPAGTLLGKLTGTAGSDPWVQELKAKPIDFVHVVGELGNGGLALKTGRVESAAFRVDAGGGMKFAPVLTNSPLQIPVSIALERKLAEKAVLLDPSTPANAAYSALPQFVTLKGTLGAPKADIDYVAIGALGLKTMGRAAGGLGSNLGSKVAGAAGLLGNLTGGSAASTNAVPATNNAGNALGNALGNLLGGGARSTNVPAKSTNAPANPVGDLLRGLGRPKN